MKKILAADDDPVTTELYKHIFEKAGYEIKIIGDASGAIICCEEFKPDLLILDWEMPAGGGSRVFEKICGLLGKRLPVIFITGFPEKVKVERTGNKVVILEKPPGVKAMLNEVAKLLKAD